MIGNESPVVSRIPERAVDFLAAVGNCEFASATELGEHGIAELRRRLTKSGMRVAAINNRRYLGNKHSIAGFIRSVIDDRCTSIETVADVFSGTGAVANTFTDKTIITNDLLYSNYLSSVAWFSPEDYRPGVIVWFVRYFNLLSTSENNYFRQTFAGTYFSADDCSRIGAARDMVETARQDGLVNDREFAILVNSILYGMDRVAKTVGHYDAFRRHVDFDDRLDFPVLLPQWGLSEHNRAFNLDANGLVEHLDCDLLYLDPPYNSRQYSDAYHLLENVARWSKPEVFGVARKMDRAALKSDYNTVRAPDALRELIARAQARYIAFSYNNMADKGNGRSNAKISDKEIMEILSEKGNVDVYEVAHRPFSAGKSRIEGNAERLFICEVRPKQHVGRAIVLSPINYIGGKGKLLPQIQPLLPPTDLFVDLFAGGCNVGLNSDAARVMFNDRDANLIQLINYLADRDCDEVIAAVEEKVAHYGLSDTSRKTYAHYGATSSRGLAEINKGPYLKLREDYNRAQRPDERSLLLYILVIYGFNNQLRYNHKGLFNLPVGKRDFNSSMRRKLKLFSERIGSIEHSFTSLDFRDIDIKQTPMSTLFYCDPPYLITQATYNERGGWTDADEDSLLTYLDAIDRSGRKFALSNVTEAKGRSNDILKKWIGSRDYAVHSMAANYDNSNYQRADQGSTTKEVLITNY